MGKSLETLVEDIKHLFNGPSHKVDGINLTRFLKDIEKAVTTTLGRDRTKDDSYRPNLRMSNLGLPLRKLWFTLKEEPEKKPLDTADFIKFLYGDIIEAFLLFLIREAGHTVTHEQQSLQFEGIRGKTDCVIDGVPVDIKSSSSYGFRKFKSLEIKRADAKNDPFGYSMQLAAYVKALGLGTDGALVAFNKESGELMVIPYDVFDFPDPVEKLKEIREATKKDTPPDKFCYEPVEHKNGNVEIAKDCTFCDYMRKCHGDIRTFKYSTGPRYFKKIVKGLNVEEIYPL